MKKPNHFIFLQVYTYYLGNIIKVSCISRLCHLNCIFTNNNIVQNYINSLNRNKKCNYAHQVKSPGGCQCPFKSWTLILLDQNLRLLPRLLIGWMWREQLSAELSADSTAAAGVRGQLTPYLPGAGAVQTSCRSRAHARERYGAFSFLFIVVVIGVTWATSGCRIR